MPSDCSLVNHPREYVGWMAAVWPIIVRFGRTKFMCDLRWSWLSWSALGIAVLTVLSAPIMGRVAFDIIWYFALMGSIERTMEVLKPVCRAVLVERRRALLIR